MIPTTFAEGSLEEALEDAEPVLLTHTWPACPPPAKTTVRIAWNVGELGIRGDLEDESVTTKATGDSQHLWELGDVFEIFLEAEGAGYYSELHVSPDNHRMHLHIRTGDYEAMKANILTPSDLMIRPPGFQSRTAATPSGWTVDVRIPAELIDPAGILTPASRWKASFCRYDAWTDGRPPVLSSTSPHEEPHFHRRQDWRPLCF